RGEGGVRLVAAAPPNAATVYQDDLPAWVQNSGRKTEYDLYMDGLAARAFRPSAPPVTVVLWESVA
ncbi:MAG: hypothetical protein JO288_10105, partial [Hyphomicrobiales bacterium]|nr:hypothetical protein [Hyphomicrobiales bacterium]